MGYFVPSLEFTDFEVYSQIRVMMAQHGTLWVCE
jgi:hypothetical protein